VLEGIIPTHVTDALWSNHELLTLHARGVGSFNLSRAARSCPCLPQTPSPDTLRHYPQRSNAGSHLIVGLSDTCPHMEKRGNQTIHKTSMLVCSERPVTRSAESAPLLTAQGWKSNRSGRRGQLSLPHWPVTFPLCYWSFALTLGIYRTLF
jgi:hypothetical protein